MILTSNQSFGAWGEVFGDRVIITATVDRLLHHAVTLNVRGNSYRLKEKLKAGLLRSYDDSGSQPGGEIWIATHGENSVVLDKRRCVRYTPKFDLRTQLFKMCGVDLTRIDGIDVTTALAVISETGADMSRFATVGHFASWLVLCPGTKITGAR